MPYVPDIFGQIVSGDQLENAAITTLEAWFKTYARELEIQLGLPQDALPLPRAFLTVDKVDKGNADQLPCVVVVSPGFAGRKPQQEGDGTYRAFFSLGVGCFVSGKDRTSTRNLARWYTAIIRAIMIQRQSLGGFADGTAWLDESYDDNFNFTDTQTISFGQCVFEIDVVGVVKRFGGPTSPDTQPDPDTQPGSQWPTANTVDAIVEMEA